MLDEKDLQAIAALLSDSESRTAKRIEKTEKLLFDEMGKVQTYLEKQISQVQKNLEELQQYYQITPLPDFPKAFFDLRRSSSNSENVILFRGKGYAFK